MPAKKKVKKRERSPGPGEGEYGYDTIRKDPLDLRDLYYEGSLRALATSVDNRERVPRVLDQGREGACTGFGLAAVVNYLVHNHPDSHWAALKAQQEASLVSARMLYEMAKRYDEWPGEDYDGSSIRAAMKGWHRHGVCSEPAWPYAFGRPGRFTDDAQADALHRPLGNYFRVRHLHLSQVHAAIQEVGILYASAEVHEGWTRVDRRTGRIPFRGSERRIGGHAFALVGYDREGFWIQNSWGRPWGLAGFGHVSYEDWLEHAWDCWVARLAVPARVVSHRAPGMSVRTSSFGLLPDEPVALRDIRGHFVNLGNGGKLSTSGRYATSEADIADIFARVHARIEEWGGAPRLLLYAHGGLNDERASAQRVARLLPTITANRVYPVHFMWETGVLETVRHIVEDAFRARRFQGWADELKERFFDLLDEAIELAARPLGRPLWGEMKENARGASGAEGGVRRFARELARFRSAHRGLEVHLVGHSAGSILHGHLIRELAGQRIPVKSLTLFAPAVTTELFKREVVPGAKGAEIAQLAVFNLSDDAERDDAIGPYQKSLLYLVSEAFERRKPTPLLGMEKHFEDDEELGALFGRAAKRADPTVIHTRGVPRERTLESRSDTHGGFDDDVSTLNSMLRIVLGSNRLARRFEEERRPTTMR